LSFGQSATDWLMLVAPFALFILLVNALAIVGVVAFAH
jgi:hypothetical protein